MGNTREESGYCNKTNTLGGGINKWHTYETVLSNNGGELGKWALGIQEVCALSWGMWSSSNSKAVTTPIGRSLTTSGRTGFGMNVI